MPQTTVETAGYLLARTTLKLPPWWRFRLYHHVHKRLLGDPYWCDASPSPVTWARVRPHGFEMELSRSDWMERYALHTGAFYSIEVVEVIATMLREGDCFVDVGANIGFVTLCASRIVGPRGRVLSFEPNPSLVARLERVMARNGITNVTILPFAAGETAGEIGFSQYAHHGVNHVIADLAAAPIVVPIRRADDLLRDKLPADGRVMVKMDVEGAEMMALRGMPDLIARPDTAFLIEISDARLRDNGTSAAAIFDLMKAAGYAAFLPFFSPFSAKLRMDKLANLPAREKVYDVLFRRVG